MISSTRRAFVASQLSWSSCLTSDSLSIQPIWCYWVAGFIIGLGLAVVEFTMTAGILSRWFHTNYGTVTGIVFAFTGVGGVVWNLIGQIVLGPQLAGWHELYSHLLDLYARWYSSVHRNFR